MKTTHQADNNAAKTIALDHLGVIAARIRSSTSKVEKDVTANGHGPMDLRAMDEVNRIPQPWNLRLFFS